jgi:hypothetical protein
VLVERGALVGAAVSVTFALPGGRGVSLGAVGLAGRWVAVADARPALSSPSPSRSVFTRSYAASSPCEYATSRAAITLAAGWLPGMARAAAVNWGRLTRISPLADTHAKDSANTLLPSKNMMTDSAINVMTHPSAINPISFFIPNPGPYFAMPDSIYIKKMMRKFS